MGWKPARRLAIARYLRADLVADAGAGVSVAVLAVPQAMAFALLAGLPPVHGLYAAMVGVVVASAAGSSPLMISGPTNAISVVLLSSTAGVPADGRLDHILLLTMLVGAFQCLLGAARLGHLLRYVSNSVVVGFTAGAGLLIMARQAPPLLGLHDLREARFFGLLSQAFDKVAGGEVLIAPLALGAGTIIVIVALQRLEPRIPGTLIAVVLSALAAKALGPTLDQVDTVGAGAEQFRLLPTPYFPRFQVDQLEDMAGSAVAIALLGLVQSASIARALAERSAARLDLSREFLAQGLMNVSCAALRGFAGCGSFVRSSLNASSGARTRMAGVFSGAAVVLIVFLLRPLIRFIPRASLAGVIIVVAIGMIDWKHVRIAFRSTRGSSAVLLATLAATLILRLQFAIYVGVFLSLAIFLRLSSSLNVTRWVPAGRHDLREQPIDAPYPAGQATVVNIEGDLFFGAVRNLEEHLARVAARARHVVVLRLRRVRAMGSTAAEALLRFHHELEQRGIRLLICGVEEDLYEILRKSGLRRALGRQNLFLSGNVLLDSTRRALKAAQQIIHKGQIGGQR
jgi:SulP family sulfate permease